MDVVVGPSEKQHTKNKTMYSRNKTAFHRSRPISTRYTLRVTCSLLRLFFFLHSLILCSPFDFDLFLLLNRVRYFCLTSLGGYAVHSIFVFGASSRFGVQHLERDV